jgi:hypothetical protein
MKVSPFPSLSKASVALIGAIALAALLSGWGISRHVFWDDEANTAVLARNLLHFGKLTGWDGTNVMAFRGGVDLDDRLLQQIVPPLQYYVAAAGLAVFGETSLGGRLPFLILGLVALWMIARGAARLMGPGFPAWLPALFLALNVPYLLYIRQCRYFALVFLAFAALLWAWSALGDAARPWRVYLGGAVAALALFFANYMSGVAALCGLAVLLVEPRCRDWRHLGFLALAGAVVGGGLLSLPLGQDTLDAAPAVRDAVPYATAVMQLLAWQVEGLGIFEFAPVSLFPILALPFLVARLAPYRPVAAKAGALLLAMLVFLAAVALTSPQPVAVTEIADMRYVLPVMVLGSIIVAACLVIVAASSGRAVAVAFFAFVVLSNVAYPGAARLRCTLCEYVSENLGNHPSGTDAMVAYARTLPKGTLVQVVPGRLTPPLIFYAPDLHFVDMLSPDKEIDPDIKRQLPAYLFENSVPAGVLLVAVGPSPLEPGTTYVENGRAYRVEQVIRTLWVDETRPELPMHRFRPDPALDQQHGIAILRPASEVANER